MKAIVIDNIPHFGVRVEFNWHDKRTWPEDTRVWVADEADIAKREGKTIVTIAHALASLCVLLVSNSHVLCVACFVCVSV